MGLTELSIRKPAAVIMFVLLIAGLGIYAYINLRADLFPAVKYPVVTIITEYDGASVSEIENDIIKPTEDELIGISGIDTIRSGAVIGYGYTIVMFKMDVNPDAAFLDVQQAMGVIENGLPADAQTPIIKKYDKNTQPVLMLSVSGSLPYDQLAGQAEDIKDQLERIEGVGNVTLAGKQEKQLQIDIDRSKLDYYGISLNTVVKKLEAENLNVPLGEISQAESQQPLRLVGEFKNIHDIRELRINTPAGATVPLSELADVSLRYAEPEQKVRYNGKSSIGIFVQKQNDANIIEVVDAVKQQLAEMKKTLPTGLQVSISSDRSAFIHATLRDVKKNLLEAIIFTALIMFLFLRNWRSALIVLVSIPTSLIATFMMMYLFGFSINIITILALSLCIGILVDDSIVVLENIERHRKQGQDPVTAAVEGRGEIAMAAIAITLCDVVVFGPVAFLTDIVGQFFRQFGITVVVATLFSLAVSFTLTPMLAARMLKEGPDGEGATPESDPAQTGSNNRFYAGMLALYKRFLVWALDNRWKIVTIITAGVVLSVLLIPLGYIKSEFMPQTDQSSFTINLALAPGSNLKQTDEKVQVLEKHLQKMPEIESFMAQMGSSTGDDRTKAAVTVNLVPKGDRDKRQAQIVKELRNWGGTRLSGVDFTVVEDSLFGKTSLDGSNPVAINIYGSDYPVLQDVARQVEAAVKSVPGTEDVDNSDKGTQSEYQINIDRVMATQMGLSTAEIASTLRTAVNGTDVGLYRSNGDEYDIMVRVKDSQIKTPHDIGSIRISNAAGQSWRLDEMAAISRGDNTGELLRRDRQRLITVTADIQGRALGDIDADITQKINAIDVPAGVTVKFGADQENMRTGFKSLIQALIISILLIYMILVVLYESYLTPFIRMMSIPCGMIGALAALAMTHNNLNIVTLIGLIMLDGIASKNGTLLIDYTNTLMKRGLPLREALIQSGTTRFRPILMTSVTMIAGMLPVALAVGAGSEIKAGMAISLIGGMVTSTLLSPVFLPVVYTLMDDMKRWRTRHRNNPEVRSV